MNSSLRIAIIHTVLALICVLPSFGLQIASVMSGANAPNTGSVGVFVVIAGMVLPYLLIIATLGVWLCYALGWSRVMLICVAVPWIWLALLLGATLLMFSLAGRQ